TALVVIVLLLPLFGFFYALTIEAAVAFDKLAYLFDDGGRNLVDGTLQIAERSGLKITRQFVTDYLGQLATGLNSVVVAFGGAVFGNVLAFTIHAAIEIVMIFYLFADGDRLRAFLFRLSPLPDHEDALLVDT